MTTAVIVSTARTPLAKSWKGSFNMTHGATLGGHAVEHAMARAGIEPGEVDDVIMGCATPEGATGANIARQVALRAGCPRACLRRSPLGVAPAVLFRCAAPPACAACCPATPRTRAPRCWPPLRTWLASGSSRR